MSAETIETQLQAAIALVRGGQRFLVCCHNRPDADALGSAMGFVEILRAEGKEVSLYVPDELASNLLFLGAKPLKALPEGARFDAIWVMDTAARELLPRGLPQDGGTLVIVDHHAAHDDVGDLIVRDSTASSTAEVVLEIAARLGQRPVPSAAVTPLYAGLVADTGGFRYASTSAKTLRLGAELVEGGADVWKTAYELFEGWTAERMSLLGAVLEGMTLECEGRVTLMSVTRALLESIGAHDDMVEGLVDYGRKLRGVEIAALLWEYPSSEDQLDIKVSLRSRGQADVSKVAVALGGGGHKGASGATLHGPLDAVREKVLEEIRRALPGDDPVRS